MKYLISAISALLLLMAAACSESSTPGPVHKELNSVYYWKTAFHLDSADIAFIKRHDVGRVYLRMFDVSVDTYADDADELTFPNASVRFDYPDYLFVTDSLGDKEFVPVVFVTLEALRAMKSLEGTLARNIVTRVRNMCEYNQLPNVGEIQLDCDWTTSTEESYFALCDSAKSVIAELELPWRLSSTIRLHQLSRKVPPVDNGVLMVYNTGDFNDPDAENSILNMKDVVPYLKHLSGYDLHLDIAYPTYSWQLLFRKRRFVGLLNGLNPTDTARFSQRSDNVFVARRDIPFNDRQIFVDDVVRQEASEFAEIADVKRLIERELAGREHSNILYHLDSKNLSKYSDSEIDHIFATGI